MQNIYSDKIIVYYSWLWKDFFP